MQEVLQSLGPVKMCTTALHPHSIDMVERYTETVVEHRHKSSRHTKFKNHYSTR
jgi:hypothetical protein